MRVAGMLLLAGVAACSVAPSSGRAAAESADVGVAAAGFPRIAAYYIESYVGPEQEAVMAKADLVVVDAESAALDRAPFDRIRHANPGAGLFAYLTSEEIPHDADPKEKPLAAARFAKITPSEWMVEPGSRLTKPISATTTKLEVADGRAFRVERPASDFYEADEPTYLLVDGEHMRLLAIEGNTLTVERGYRSAAVAHTVDAKVTTHVVFFAGTWMLDLATNGWRALLVDEAVDLVHQGPWNGLFMDVCFEDISWLNGGLLDVDRNGTADDPAAASAQWSAGMGELVDALRRRLPTTPIMANPGGQNCPHSNLDGVLLEGWPIGLPPDYLDFDIGLNRYLDWSTSGHAWTVANGFSSKIGFGTIDRGADEIARTDWAAMRFGLGVALLGDGLYAFDNGVFGHYVTWWYDEYDGAGRGRGWLGRPRSTFTRTGDVYLREFEHGLAVVNAGKHSARVPIPDGFAKLSGRQDPRHNDGAVVHGALTVAARDAYLLVRE